MRKRFHGLKKPKVRADWSKWTLYNISRLQTPPARSKTFFQQKWLAKSLTRAYHGEQIREGKWTRMFDRRLPAVVPMDYKLLARTDGSEQAQGRGSGLNITKKKDDSDGSQRESTPQRTPYMHMTYFPTERRLDTAVWRALFASSARQARQFVVHGSVKVNGKKMVHPGYLLNPGDMFSVDPERVLYATGARKHNKNTPDTLQGREEPDQVEQIVDEDAEDGLDESEAKDNAEKAAAKATKAAKTIPSADEDPKAALKSLLARAQDITKESKEGLSGKRKQDLRAFAKSVKQTMSRLRPSGLMKPGTETIDTLEETLKAIAAKVPVEGAPAETALPDQEQKPVKREDAFRARKDAELLHAALARANENPIDASKPYATPWRPREFMSAFAFIPRYLEVNQKICSAVYLRHPVARPGLAEVPTPFANETMALAFNWYLRRR